MQRGQGLLQFGEHRAPVELFAVILVAIHGKEHLGLDLLEAFDHAARAKVRGAARPDRPDARTSQKCNHRFREIGHVGHDPVPRLYPKGSQRIGHRTHVARQFLPRDCTKRVPLGLEEQSRITNRSVSEDLLGIIELSPSEPLGTRHLPVRQHRGIRPGGLDGKEVPDRGPEVLEVAHRPVPQFLLVANVQPFFTFEPLHISCERGLLLQFL